MLLILVVEDDTSLRETLVYNLKHQEYGVESVGDGFSALKAARTSLPDLALSKAHEIIKKDRYDYNCYT